MYHIQDVLDTRYALDGNAVGGLLNEVFGEEMTVTPARCAHCERVSVVGEMLVFGRDMGAVLRCPNCAGVMMRVLRRDDEIWLDMQGVTNLRLPRYGEPA